MRIGVVGCGDLEPADVTFDRAVALTRRRGRVHRRLVETDDIGLHVVDRRHDLRDVHAQILNELEIDQQPRTYPRLGRDERLTFVEDRVIRELIRCR